MSGAEEVLGEAFQEKILIPPDAQPKDNSASSTPSLVPPPSPLPRATFGREQPLSPCGPAPLLLSAPCFLSCYLIIEPSLEHLLLLPTDAINYHGGYRHIRDYAPHWSHVPKGKGSQHFSSS